MNYGLEIRNIATSKCLLVHALTHPAEKKRLANRYEPI